MKKTIIILIASLITSQAVFATDINQYPKAETPNTTITEPVAIRPASKKKSRGIASGIGKAVLVTALGVGLLGLGVYSVYESSTYPSRRR